jgi:hypothetical protein
MAVAKIAESKASEGLAEAKATRFNLGVREPTFGSVVSADLGSRRLQVSVPGPLITDRVVAYKAGTWPLGYAILGPGYVSAPDIVEVDILTPTLTALQLGQVTLPFQFFAIRPAT